jgi:hypothetical protein
MHRDPCGLQIVEWEIPQVFRASSAQAGSILDASEEIDEPDSQLTPIIGP